ncbi:hypothetical protein LCGC14_2527900 [marine sediment metagenome]|uniref:Uncharacterized protein n=1 Tax=marine sediment metagenome TaxID=412755 RepID=A0A0F9BHE0_9ZZZZ
MTVSQADVRQARTLGLTATLKFVLAERTLALIGLMFDGFATGKNVKGLNNVKIGNLNVDDDYTKILVRPKNPNHPFFYMPRALVVDFRAIVWDDHIKHLDPTEITVVPTLDDTSNPWYYGDPSTFPALP